MLLPQDHSQILLLHQDESNTRCSLLKLPLTLLFWWFPFTCNILFPPLTLSASKETVMSLPSNQDDQVLTGGGKMLEATMKHLQCHSLKFPPFTNAYLKCSQEKWINVLWSDESWNSFWKPWTWTLCPADSRGQKPSSLLSVTVKNASLMVWSCIIVYGVGSFHTWKGSINT